MQKDITGGVQLRQQIQRVTYFLKLRNVCEKRKTDCSPSDPKMVRWSSGTTQGHVWCRLCQLAPPRSLLPSPVREHDPAGDVLHELRDVGTDEGGLALFPQRVHLGRWWGPFRRGLRPL